MTYFQAGGGGMNPTQIYMNVGIIETYIWQLMVNELKFVKGYPNSTYNNKGFFRYPKQFSFLCPLGIIFFTILIYQVTHKKVHLF